jgi:WD40 repeat protein/tRNA A-37 threonylcarbamoyl transferase component Bud32
MSRCPGRDRFERFLAECLDDRSREELERHVESCSACQEVLDALTDVADWGPIPRPAGAVGADEFLRRLQESPPRAVEPLATRRDSQGVGEVGGRSTPAHGPAPDRTEPAFEVAPSGPGPIEVATSLGAAPPGPSLTAATEVASADPDTGAVAAPWAPIDGAGAAADELASRAPPVISGYELLGELGRGGMGVVYRARQVRLDRSCALKMILAGSHAARESVARFLAEARAIARLQHPHIVQIHHIGEADGLPFFELEYLPGGSLDRQLDGTPWPPRRAAGLVEQLARAMAEAHHLGVVHRDLKPANVLLAADGTPKITDFGLAKMLDSESGLTRTDLVMGSPSYMAPEQAGGHAREAGPAVDVYALGAILYELLTGRPPFRGATAMETMEQVRGSEPVSPSRLVPRLPRDIETICLQCLPKEPTRRYEGASALAEDLRRFQAGEPIVARRISGAERAWRWCRRNPLVASLLASVGLLIVAIAIVSSVAAARLGVEARRAQGAESDAVERLLRAAFAQAKASRGSGRIGQRHDTLKALAEAAALTHRVAISPPDILDMRAEAIAAMALPDIHLGHEWEGNPAGTNGRAFNSTYERYALSKRDGELTVRRVTDNQVLHRFVVTSVDGLNRQATLRFSPNDRYLAAYYNDSVTRSAFVWDLANPEAHPLVSVRDCSSSWSFFESRRLAVIGTRDQRIRRFDLGTGHELEPLKVGILPSAVAVQPQGHVLAVAAIGPPVVRLFDMASGQLLNALSHAQVNERAGRHATGGVEGLAWHPSGEFLATACDDQKIYVWDWLSKRQRSVLSGHSWEVADLAFSHSGDLLASYGHDKTVRLWDYRAGALLLTIPEARWVGFSQDDRIFTAQAEGTRLALCHLDMPVEFRVFEGHCHGHRHRQDIHDIQIHHGRRILATAASDGVRLWDLVAGREIAYLSTAHSLGTLFEKDGAGLLTYDTWQLRRWPLEISTRARRERVQIGPPRRLLNLDAGSVSPFGRMTFCGPDQKRLAIVCLGENCGVNLIDWAPQPRVVQSWRTRTADFVASSPDGRWVATGSVEGAGFLVWDTLGNTEVRRWDTGGDVHVAFSPEGRWLVCGTGGSSYTGAECSFWKVGTWQRGMSIPLERTTPASQSAFSDDGRMFAVLRTMTEILLLDPRDLREVARLQSREPMILSCLRFSADGSLLAAGTAAGYFHVWDLRRIRARLAEMNLDWNLPPFSPSPAAPMTGNPLAVDLRLDPGSLVDRANYFLEIPDYRRALADLEEALALDPDRLDVRRGLVSILTNGPMAIRNLGRASELLRTAPGHDATNLAYRGDLGMIMYRQSRYAAAVEALEAALGTHADRVDRTRWRIFIAMSQHHLGQSRAAQANYERARFDLADAKLSPLAAEELPRLWAEADATLHVGRSTP